MATYVTDVLREIAMAISTMIAGLIGTLYDVILALGTSRIFTDEFYVNFASKVGLLLGIYMLFRLMLALITYLVDPDKISDKKEGAGKIVVRVIVVIVLLASYNTLFNTLYNVQNEVLTSDFFPNLFFDKDATIIQNGGKFALQYSSIFASLEKADDTGTLLINLPTEDELVELYGIGGPLNWVGFHAALRYMVIQKAQLSYNIPILGGLLMSMDTFFSSDHDAYAYHFDAIPCLIFLGFMCYSMFIYAIKLGARVAQLAFLQLIAPVPIISYMDPKSESLKKWAKITAVTYADVFVRMAIFFFIAFFSYQTMGAKIVNVNNASFGSEWLVKLLIMCGMLIVGNKFPDLLKKIFNLGDAGEFGLSAKNAMGILYNPFRKNNAMIGGAISSGVGAIVGGGKGLEIATSMLRGGKEGLKSGKFFGSITGGYHGGIDASRARSIVEAGGPVDSDGVRSDYLALLRNQNTRYMNFKNEDKYMKSEKDALSRIKSAISGASVISKYQSENENYIGDERKQREKQLSAMKKYLYNRSMGIDTVPSDLAEKEKGMVDDFITGSSGQRTANSIWQNYNAANAQADAINSLESRAVVLDKYGNNSNSFGHIESYDDIQKYIDNAEAVSNHLNNSAEAQQYERDHKVAMGLRVSGNKFNEQPVGPRRGGRRGGLGGPPPGGPSPF